MTSLHRETSLLVAAVFFLALPATAGDLQKGDVLAACGIVQNVYSNSGVFKEQSFGLSSAGWVFFRTETDQLYVSALVSPGPVPWILVYDGHHPHTVMQSFPVAVNGPITVAPSGDVYVSFGNGGNPTTTLYKYSSSGALADTFTVASDNGIRGLCISYDESTVLYTSDGRRVLAYAIRNHAQLPDFAVLPVGARSFGLRLLPPFNGDAGLLVASHAALYRVDLFGNVVKTYDIPAFNYWQGVALDPNGTSFWASDVFGNAGSSQICRFDIRTGAVEVGPFPAFPGGLCNEIAVVGEPPAKVRRR